MLDQPSMNLIYIILICFVVVDSLLRHMDLENEKKLNLINVNFTIALQTSTIDIQVKIAADKYAK